MADQQSAMKEFRSLDKKRTREGLTAEEETRYARLRDLVGPEGGAATPRTGFDINAAAARLRDSLVPAGLRNRPPPVPAPAPVAPPPEPEPVEAAAPGPWDPTTPPYDPSAPEWDAGAAAPDQQGWDPAAQAEWDPNAAPAEAGQGFDPNAPAWDAAAAAPDQQGWDPAAQPEWDPNAPPAEAGQGFDPNAPVWDATAATPDLQGWDPAAQPESEPDVTPVDAGQSFDPDAPAWDAAAAAPDQQGWDPAAQPEWDPTAAPVDAGAALDAALDPNETPLDSAVEQDAAAFEAQPFEPGAQDLDPPAFAADGAPADLLAAAAAEGGWAGEAEPLAEAAFSPGPFEDANGAGVPGGVDDAGFAAPSALDPSMAVLAEPGIPEELGIGGGELGGTPEFAQEASPSGLADDLDPSGFQAVKAIETAATDAWQPDPADLDAGFSLESGGSFDAAADAAAPAWAGGTPTAPWEESASEAQPQADALAPGQSLSDILEPIEGATGDAPADDLAPGQSLADLLEPVEPEVPATGGATVDLVPGQSLSDLLEPADPEAASAAPLEDDLPQGQPLSDLFEPVEPEAPLAEPPQDDLSQGQPLSDLLEPVEPEAPLAEPPQDDLSQGQPLSSLLEPAEPEAPLAEPPQDDLPQSQPLWDLVEPVLSEAPKAAAPSVAASHATADVLDTKPKAVPVRGPPDVPQEPELAAPEPAGLPGVEDFAVDFEETPEPPAKAPELDFSRPDLSAGFEEESFDISFDEDDSPAPSGGAQAEAPAPQPAAAAASTDAEQSDPASSDAPAAGAADEVPTIEGEEIVDDPARAGAALPQLEIEEPTPPPAAIASKLAAGGVEAAIPASSAVPAAAAAARSAASTVTPAAPAPAAAPDFHITGVKRVVVHTVEGQVKRGVLENADLDASLLRLAANPGAPPESIAREKVKAIFFMLDTGEKTPPAEGKRVRVTFNDGRQVAGFSPDYREEGIGFFMSPGDTRTNTGRIWVYRAAVRQVFVS